MVAADEREPDLDALRQVLVGPERAQLADLQARLDDPQARADDVAAVLPQVLLQHAGDPHLTRALSPPLERALTQSVQRNPQPLANALFPVMGPAIRKAVAAGLAGMVESLNRTLELAMSPRSIRWRIEAVRTGKSFAEIVLAKTLIYRVEQAFLIDRNSGLLLQHVQAPDVVSQDADMVSGMLTAIRDFVQDSFKVAAGESLDSLQVGELAVWIEPGPHAIVAAVIRGTAPRELRPIMQDAVETIHLQFGPVLEAYDGDASTLEGSRPALESCLQTQYRAGERKPSPRGAIILGAIAAVALLVWLGFGYRGAQRRAAYLEALQREPGLVVMSSERDGGKFVVQGLRDPLARDPLVLVAGTGLTAGDVDGRWAPYLSLDPEMVAARARTRLAAPDSVGVTVDGDVLRLSGVAPAAWIGRARDTGALVTGVRVVDVTAAVDDSAAAILAAVDATSPLFARGAARLAPGQDEVLARLVIHMRELDALATAAGVRYQVEIAGHTDSDGPDAANVPLSRARADFVRDALQRSPLPSLDIVTTGEGSRRPAAASADEESKQRNRRVTIRATRQSD